MLTVTGSHRRIGQRVCNSVCARQQMIRLRCLHKDISNLSLRARKEHMMLVDKIGVTGTHAIRALYEIL